MLSTFVRRFSDLVLQKIVLSIQRGASLVYRHGLLRKGVGLCHGVGGSVFALLAVSDAFHHLLNPEMRSKYLLRAMHLAFIATA